MSFTQTETLSQPPLFLFNPKHRLQDAFVRPPDELVYLALMELSLINIELIEFRLPLYARMNVPAMMTHYTYLVPDEQLHKASEALLELGLPAFYPDNTLQGDFLTLAKTHRITRSTAPGLLQYLSLLPASFASFTPEELSEIHILPPKGSSFDHTLHIYSPRPSAVYSCLFRALSRYPRSARTRGTLLADLAELIRYNLLKATCFNEETIDDDAEEYNVDDDPDVQDALGQVRRWSEAGEWREGEEWIGDCLAAVVSGKGRIELVPWKTG
ncbi:hypothetical protein VNI00_011419 [Paramarasmius palmivorus]|uniref:Uncharacterized protein n=1 Tax=Paramarasmius palmivorus TaxID=297713 RepID=A0AAW0CDT4_9AGAR